MFFTEQINDDDDDEHGKTKSSNYAAAGRRHIPNPFRPTQYAIV